MEPWVTSEKRTDSRTVVNRSSIPEQDDVAAEMTEQQPQEAGDLNVGDVVEVEVAVETEVLADSADGDRGDGGDLVVVVAVDQPRGFAPRRPGAADRWDEQKAALVQERQVRPQPARFFLISTHR
jgi:hypothetical protein